MRFPVASLLRSSPSSSPSLVARRQRQWLQKSSANRHGCTGLLATATAAPPTSTTTTTTTILRWHTSSSSPSSRCPHSDGGRSFVSSSSSSTTGEDDDDNNKSNDIPLHSIPMLPYLGSLVPAYSKTPPFDPDNFYEFYPEHRRRFGNFYKMGIPGIGKGNKGEIHVLVDPNEFQKIVRQNDNTSKDGVHFPKGFIESEWPLIEYLQKKEEKKKATTLVKSKNHPNLSHDQKGFYGRGPTWKRLRSFLQQDLLSPQSARGYVHGMIQAAQIASDAIADGNVHNEIIVNNHFMNACAFDMFSSVMFGELTRTAHPKHAQSTNLEYCEKTILGFETMTELFFNQIELLKIRMLGMETPLQRKMTSAFDDVFQMSHDKFVEFQKKYNSSNLTELEANSYLANALARQGDSDITDEELSDMIKVMLSAAIHTTSSYLGWNIYHVAVNHTVQQKLYEELTAAVANNDGIFDETVLQKSNTPFLHTIIRESHRLTPVLPIPIQKENSAPITIHGNEFESDTLFFLDPYSLGVDPEYIGNDPYTFDPDRWSDDAVAARKGTKSEVLDHPYYKTPFSEGSRKCPGSRVANYEALVLLSQLVLDWRIEASDHIKGFHDMTYALTGIMTPTLPELTFTKRNNKTTR